MAFTAIGMIFRVVAEVHVFSWRSTYHGLIPDKFLDDLSVEAKTKEWVKYLTSGIEVWAIEKDSKIIGFASVCPCRDKDMDPKVVAEISAIYLLQEFWHQGLGQQLNQVIFEEMKKQHFKEIITWVLEKNLSARKFYEKVGFASTNDIKTDHFGCESLKVVRYRKYLT